MKSLIKSIKIISLLFLISILSLQCTQNNSEIKDTRPDSFSFKELTNQKISTLVYSNEVTIEGINQEIEVNISGNETARFSINGAEYKNSGTIKSGDKLKLQVQTAVQYNIAITINIKIGDITQQWIVTTKPYKSVTMLGSFNEADIDKLIYNSRFGVAASQITTRTHYDVTLYKIEYNSFYKGENITESALLTIPNNIADMSQSPVLSIQHGTIAKDGEEPSAVIGQFAKGNTSEGVIGIIFSSMGYPVIAPDYVGFGSSNDLIHPYLIKDSSRKSVYNAIKFLYNFDKENNMITLSDQLYSFGYSEGGYVSVAAQDYIETNPIDGVVLKGTFAGGGPYDLNYLKETILEREEYNQPFFLAFALTSFNDTYNDFPTDYLSKIYKSPYDINMKGVFDGSKNGDEINALITYATQDLYTEVFLKNEGDDFKYIKDAAIENSITAWNISTPLHLYHGANDELVAKDNSIRLRTTLNNDDLVTYKELTNPIITATHGNSGLFFFLEIFSNESIPSPPQPAPTN